MTPHTLTTEPPSVAPSVARRGVRSQRPHSRLALVASAAYAIATVVVLLAWMLVGDTWWLQPLNLTTFWWPLPAVAFALLALATRHWRALAWLLVPVLAWAWIFGTAVLPPGAVDPATPADLRVVSYNTFVATPDSDHVVDLAVAQAADIVLLMEVFPGRQAELETAFGDILPHTAAMQSDGVGGVMVASRHPIVDVLEVPTVEGARSTFVAVVDVDGTLVQVAPMHLRSPCLACGDSVSARLDLEGVSREAEVAAVLDVLDPSMPAIVGGDLNSTARSLPYRELVGAGFDDPQVEVGSGPGFTWPANGRLPAPVVRIDWLLSRGLDPVAAWVPPAGPSDHRPVAATFNLQEPA